MMDTKRCTTCLRDLPTSDFSVRRASPDGLAYLCRGCSKTHNRRWRATHQEHLTAFEQARNQLPERRALQRESATRWQKADPRRPKAHKIVQKALRNGTLKREPCEHCGAADAQAHHGDYDQPLKVRWYCDWHHRQHHAIMRVMGTWGG